MKKFWLLFAFFVSLNAKVYEFIDQASNLVSIEVPVKKMVVMQHHSFDILAQLKALDLVVATEKNIVKDLGEYIKTIVPNIDNLPKVGDLVTYNIEEIAKLKPDIVIAASQANKEQLKQLNDLGIKTAVISLRSEGLQKEAQNPILKDANKAYTDGLYEALEILSTLSGKEKEAKEIANFIKESRDYIKSHLNAIKDEDRIKVFIANEGNKTYGNDKYVGVQLLNAGAINVAAKHIQGYKPYTYEMLASLNPDVIIVQDRYKNVYDEIMQSAKYKNLKAYKDEKIILAPYWTKPWGNPSTDSFALGELWLAYKFYPNLISKDYVLKRAKEFYKRFYGIDFNEKDFEY